MKGLYPIMNRQLRGARPEALFWLAGLVGVALADPAGEGLISVCLFDAIGSALGFAFCPGCGLGHAVGFLVRGDLSQSFAHHPLAIPAVLVLLLHIGRLLMAPRPVND